MALTTSSLAVDEIRGRSVHGPPHPVHERLRRESGPQAGPIQRSSESTLRTRKVVVPGRTAPASGRLGSVAEAVTSTGTGRVPAADVGAEDPATNTATANAMAVNSRRTYVCSVLMARLQLRVHLRSRAGEPSRRRPTAPGTSPGVAAPAEAVAPAGGSGEVGEFHHEWPAGFGEARFGRALWLGQR